MPATTAQLEAITHAGGPLLILAGAGTGKTRTLVERFAWLVEQGTPADAILVLTDTPASAEALRAQVEERLGAWARFEELSVTTLQAFCARLLREEALEAGVDPFVTPVTAADRLALLLERIDELPLASHDLRGNPSAVLGSIVGRVITEGKTVQVADVLADPSYKMIEQAKMGGIRTVLGVPLLREGTPIGVIILQRKAVWPFSDKQIELVATFADQAVIAIENVRLFDEVQARTVALSTF